MTAERVTQAAPPLTWGLSGDFSVGNDFFFFDQFYSLTNSESL